MIQRRESVYYSPDDIGGALAGTMASGAGAGGSGAAGGGAAGGAGAGWIGIPGVRIIAPTPSPTLSDDGMLAGSSGTEMELSCSGSSSRSSEWTDYDPDSESYDDLGRGGFWDIRASSREERVYPEEEEYYGMAVGSPREMPGEYHPGRRWAGG
jgi:hypothetical protein